MASAFVFAFAQIMLIQVTSAMYFYAEPNEWRCFQDTVVSNYVSELHHKVDTCQTLEMEIQILDS